MTWRCPRSPSCPRGASRSRRHVVPARQAALRRACLGARARGGRQGQPGLRRLPADRRPTPASRAPSRNRSTTDDATERRRPLRAVLEVLPELVAGPLEGLRVEMLHGQLPSEVKDEVMLRFNHGLIDVLVATTVVEVGVDVPNATVMVVMDADRFGVSQLHQLRGRVGRGDQPALCLFVTDAEEGSPARDRLDAGGCHPGRLPAVQARPGEPARGRRPRGHPGGPSVVLAPAVRPARRGGHRAGPYGGDPARGCGSGAGG